MIKNELRPSSLGTSTVYDSQLVSFSYYIKSRLNSDNVLNKIILEQTTLALHSYKI